MSFYFYAGLAGSRTQGWHRDCGSSGIQMAVDIGGAVGSAVSFRIRNNNATAALSFQYKIDCTTFRTVTPSSVLVLVTDVPAEDEGEEVANFYVFRYTHLNIDSSITHSLSSPHYVQPGSTASQHLGTLSAVTLKSTPPIGTDQTWEELCPNAIPDLEGLTDVGGLCSTGSHLHQAASNGNDSCLRIDANGQCYPANPLSLSVPARGSIPGTITINTAVFSA